MIPLKGGNAGINFSVPRVGGGDPVLIVTAASSAVCSPRRRG